MPPHDLPVPIDPRHFEDYLPGTVVEVGPIAVSEAEVIDFGRRFDPQPFHIDPLRAAEGPFGGLITSGWHTGSLMMRLLVDHYLPRNAGLGSPGLDELRWLKPVRPGDALSLRITVLEARRSRSKPDRGLVTAYIEVLNQRREVVMSVRSMTLIRCRSPEPEPDPVPATAETR